MNVNKYHSNVLVYIKQNVLGLPYKVKHKIYIVLLEWGLVNYGTTHM